MGVTITKLADLFKPQSTDPKTWRDIKHRAELRNEAAEEVLRGIEEANKAFPQIKDPITGRVTAVLRVPPKTAPPDPLDPREQARRLSEVEQKLERVIALLEGKQQ